MADVLLRQQQFHLLQPLAETGHGFVGRNAEAPEFVGQKGAGEADVEAPAGDGVEHRDLAGKLERVIEGRHHRAGDQPNGLGARCDRREKRDRVWAVAAIAFEIMLDRTGVAIAERFGFFGYGKTLREILRGALILGLKIGKELNSELHTLWLPAVSWVRGLRPI